LPPEATAFLIKGKLSHLVRGEQLGGLDVGRKQIEKCKKHGWGEGAFLEGSPKRGEGRRPKRVWGKKPRKKEGGSSPGNRKPPKLFKIPLTGNARKVIKTKIPKGRINKPAKEEYQVQRAVIAGERAITSPAVS